MANLVRHSSLVCLDCRVVYYFPCLCYVGSHLDISSERLAFTDWYNLPSGGLGPCRFIQRDSVPLVFSQSLQGSLRFGWRLTLTTYRIASFLSARSHFSRSVYKHLYFQHSFFDVSCGFRAVLHLGLAHRLYLSLQSLFLAVHHHLLLHHLVYQLVSQQAFTFSQVSLSLQHLSLRLLSVLV